MRAIPIVGFIVISAIAAVHADQDPLTAAKELYESAAFEEALLALSRVDESAPEIARTVDQYRASCLYALGRRAEAEEVAELLFQREPLVQLDDVSPGIEAMFKEVRKRSLPRFIRAEYRIAKIAIDEKDPDRARSHLVGLKNMLDGAERLGVRDDGLADLRVLVDGFLDLMNAAPPPKTTTSPSSESEQAKRELAPQSRAVAAVYGIDDEGVVPPLIVKQSIPQVPPELARFLTARPATAVVEVVVDESGVVKGTTMRQSLHPAYDALLVAASRGWRYTPATKDGVPVKFRRTILITLK